MLNCQLGVLWMKYLGISFSVTKLGMTAFVEGMTRFHQESPHEKGNISLSLSLSLSLSWETNPYIHLPN
jgi:hypothetical protein